MTDSIRVNSAKVQPALGVRESGEAKTAASAPVRASAPNAPATGLQGAANRPAPMSMEDSASSASVGNALAKLSTAKPWGASFSFTKMSEGEAVAATTASLAALSANVHGISGEGHGFAPLRAFKDELGFSHVRLDRTFNGIKVWGEQVVTHLNEVGKVVDITGNTLPKIIEIDTNAKVGSDAAAATAAKAWGNDPATVQQRELVIIKTNDGYKLAHHVVFKGIKAPRTMNFFVDAQSGEVMKQSFPENGGFIPEFKLKQARQGAAFAVKSADAPANAEAGTGSSIYLGTVKLNTTKDGGQFVLRDPATKAETRDAKNGAGGEGSENVILTDNNNVWGEKSDDPRAKAGIDAQYAAQKMLEYLKGMYNRNSLDDKGLPLLSNVHVYDQYVNAYWDGSTMNYGDGDDQTAGPLVDKDVGSHEPMHGLTQDTCGLVYQGESGALNEAASDILGSAGFSWFLRGKGDAIPSDFLIGEDCWTPGIKGDALRYMNDPTKDREPSSGEFYSRDNYKSRYLGDEDNGGVHLNSGIANNFFFLMSQGGTNRTSGMKVENGVGIEKALRIYYRAHTTYFTPNETFAQARDAMLKAAADLYGANSAEQKVVAQAWSAVGVESAKADGVELVA